MFVARGFAGGLRWFRLKTPSGGSAAAAIALTGLLALGGCGRGSSTPAGGDSSAAKPSAATTPELRTAREVLEAMAAAYRKAARYADSGVVRLVADTDADDVDQSADFSVTFERPNKLRMHVYEAMLVCDGARLYGAIRGLGDQVLVRPAPEKLSFEAVYKDRLLAGAMSQGFAGASPQLVLLLQADPVSILLQGAEEPTLGEPGEIDGQACYRVEIRRADGTAMFWIDRDSLVLRRIVFPVDQLRQDLGRTATVHSVSMVADFVGARLDGPIDAKAFAFEIPADARQVKFLVPPNPAQLLGQTITGLELADLDGRAIDLAALRGKSLVLGFCAVSWQPSLVALPLLAKVYEQFRGDPGVVFLLVSVDQPQTTADDIRAVLQRAGVDLPVARDLKGTAAKALKLMDIPSLVVLDGRGVLQHYELGRNPKIETELPEKLRALAAGKDVYPDGAAAYEEQLRKYEASLDQPEAPPSPASPRETALVEQHEIPRAEIAPPSPPRTFRLRSLWKCGELTAPGNLIVSGGTKPRLVAIDSWKGLAEIGLDGKVVARHSDLGLAADEVVCAVREFTAADGRRWFAAFASAHQRCHVFDGEFRRLFSYPPDALENPHSGIADVQLADLDGDGAPELYVSYWGVVGVQSVALDGRRTGANRTVANVVRMAVTEPDAQGRRRLLCTNNNGSLVAFDAGLKRLDEISFPGQMLHWIVGADLLGNGRFEWCGLTAPDVGKVVAVGLNLAGRVLWTYELPGGVQPQPVEPVVPGRLGRDGAALWLLPGPDGSVHVLAADGRPIDQFCYGAALGGLATADIDGQAAIIIASQQGIEALAVAAEPAAGRP